MTTNASGKTLSSLNNLIDSLTRKAVAPMIIFPETVPMLVSMLETRVDVTTAATRREDVTTAKKRGRL